MITQQEFDAILADTTKRVTGDIHWREDVDHSPALEFRIEVESDPGWPLFLVGRWNPFAGTLSFALIHQGAGRIYALDLGADHHNPTCERVGEKHKHRWTESFRDKQAYVPKDITAPWDHPLDVWCQFCHEANIKHNGRMNRPARQEELPL
ncbi:MAG: hypothetical protein D6705_11320 [Deltaproteobacteria bacterium]|nr:MAG: hypothetical protein D6705_11320 [Deltaproteobacteria bacterium]